ncbi:hypothetical protein [Devosia naphthalenivorans]|uniref:hypothetical protein n=1 Tax=Devosia naphthalenivorans TaxID=2082392 RepID=UPI000D364504|nr:hypothetical protein [Devosia naphthalenivorans]
MSNFMHDFKKLHTAAQEAKDEMLRRDKELAELKALLAPQHDAIILAAYDAVKIDLSGLSEQVIVGHFAQLTAQAGSASFKKEAVDRATAYQGDFEENLEVRGPQLAYHIDRAIDLQSSTAVPVLGRVLETLTDADIASLQASGLHCSIQASNRSPMSVFHGMLQPAEIIEFAITYRMRFDLAPDRRATVVKAAQADLKPADVKSGTAAFGQTPGTLNTHPTGVGSAALDANRRSSTAGAGEDSN